MDFLKEGKFIKNMNSKYILLLVILFIVFLGFKRKNTRLKNTIKEKNDTIEALNQKFQEQEQNKSAYKTKKEVENELQRQIQLNIEECPEKYYEFKNTCMNRNESRIFYYLNCALDEFFMNPHERENYLVFPQMSLHAFIRILPYIKKEELLDQIASRNMVAKNVDFAICRRYKENEYYLYQPLVLIEVDGSSHSVPIFGEKAFQRQQGSDAFKDSLFQSLNIPLIRYKMERDHITRTDRDKIKQELCKYLQK